MAKKAEKIKTRTEKCGIMFFMTKKAFPVITKRVILFISVAGFVLCSLVIAASYWAFNRQFREQYDTSIREIAATARASLNPDDFEKYRANPVPDKAHKETLRLLQRLVDEFDLNVIYVSEVEPPDYRHIFYFYDPVGPKTNWKPYPLGYEEDYYEEGYNKTTRRVYEEGAEILKNNGFAEDKVCVIHNGVKLLSPEELSAAQAARSSRKAEDLPGQADVFECCVLSRYSPEKGLDMLLDGIKLVDADRPLRCTVYGRRAHLPDLRRGALSAYCGPRKGGRTGDQGRPGRLHTGYKGRAAALGSVP